MYAAAQGAIRVVGDDGKFTHSQTFDVNRGVVQGDIVIPVFFILALDQLVQTFDNKGDGVTVGHINNIKVKVLGYADDAAMFANTVEEMTERLTTFANAALEKAHMQVRMDKNYIHSHRATAAKNWENHRLGNKEES